MAAMETEVSPNDVEWVYEMRRVMQEILPKLFLGPYASGKKKDELKELWMLLRCLRAPLTSSLPIGSQHYSHHDCSICN